MSFFKGFSLDFVSVDGGDLRLRRGGDGPPLLLMHGNPQTHAMWHATAPSLAETFTVICPDLRGYGQSFKPEVTADHGPYAKRSMAKDMIQLMDHFDFEEFFVVGHDRGARVAHRMALDSPERVKKLAVLDIIPTIEHFERADMNFAMGYYHWFWLAQRHPVPEDLICAAPETWFRAHTSRGPKCDDVFHPEAMSDYLEAVRNPATIRGICEDYRAAASIDLEHDRLSRDAGEKISCPLLVLWGAKGKIEKWYEPLDIWRDYCSAETSGSSIDCGHYLAEEAPDAVLEHLLEFFVEL